MLPGYQSDQEEPLEEEEGLGPASPDPLAPMPGRYIPTFGASASSTMTTMQMRPVTAAGVPLRRVLGQQPPAAGRPIRAAPSFQGAAPAAAFASMNTGPRVQQVGSGLGAVQKQVRKSIL